MIQMYRKKRELREILRLEVLLQEENYKYVKKRNSGANNKM